MAFIANQLKVFYDREGETLTVWFGDPSEEAVVEETGDEVLLIKDAAGKVIGFEIPGSDEEERRGVTAFRVK